MLEKLLGLIDLLAAISIVLLAFDVGHGFATVMMVLLIIKSLVFITSFASWVDLASGAVIGITIFYGINIASWLVFIWLLQKWFMSLLS